MSRGQNLEISCDVWVIFVYLEEDQASLFQIFSGAKMMKLSKLWHLEILLILLIPFKRNLPWLVFQLHLDTKCDFLMISSRYLSFSTRNPMSGGRGDPVFFFYMVWEHPWSLFFERGWNEDNQFIMYILGGGFKDVSNLEEMMYFNELIFPNKMVQPPTWCVCVFKGPSLQPFFFRVVLLGFREFCFFNFSLSQSYQRRYHHEGMERYFVYTHVNTTSSVRNIYFFFVGATIIYIFIYIYI